MSMSLVVTGVWGNNKKMVSGIHYPAHTLNYQIGQEQYNEVMSKFIKQAYKGHKSLANIKSIELNYSVYSVYSAVKPVAISQVMFSGMNGAYTLTEEILSSIVSQGLKELEQARYTILQMESEYHRITSAQ